MATTDTEEISFQLVDMSPKGYHRVPHNNVNIENDSLQIQELDEDSIDESIDTTAYYGVLNKRNAKPTDSKKCLRCLEYFIEDDKDKGKCRYHAGKYKTVLTLATYGASHGKWTCCSATVQNTPGCKSGNHIEDKKTSLLLNHFNVLENEDSTKDTKTTTNTINNNSNDNNTSKNTSNSSNNSNNNIKNNSNSSKGSGRAVDAKIVSQKDGNTFVKIDNKIYFSHPVSPTDTLVGLSLKYNTKVPIIKKINKIFDDKQLYSKSHVLLPVAPSASSTNIILEAQENYEQAQKDQLIKKFQREFGITKDEAKYYVSEAEYNYDNAVKQYKDDVDFENTTTTKTTTTTTTTKTKKTKN